MSLTRDELVAMLEDHVAARFILANYDTQRAEIERLRECVRLLTTGEVGSFLRARFPATLQLVLREPI